MLVVGSTASAQDRSCKTAAPADNEVFLYEHTNFTGTCVSLQKPGTNIANVESLGLHDAISSLKVGKGVRLMVCEHINFQGKCHSDLFDVKDLNGTVVGNDEISSFKILQKRTLVAMNFKSQSDKPVLIYEKVGGVDSFLGTVSPKGQAKIVSDVVTTIVGKIDNKTIGGGFQIKPNSPPAIAVAIGPNAKGAVELMLQ